MSYIFYHNFIYKMLSYAMERAKKWWNLFCIVRNDQFEWFMWSKQELSCANCGHHIIQSENFRFILRLYLEYLLKTTAWKDAKLHEKLYRKLRKFVLFLHLTFWQKFRESVAFTKEANLTKFLVRVNLQIILLWRFFPWNHIIL